MLPAETNHATNRIKTRSASRGTVSGPAHSQPDLYSGVLPFTEGHPVFPIVTQPSPSLTARKSKRRVQELNISHIPTPASQLTLHLCGVCNHDVDDHEGWAIGCDGECGKWFHIECIGMDRDYYLNTYVNSNENTWSCIRCKKIYPNIPVPPNLTVDHRQNTMWGKYPLLQFKKSLNLCYKEIVKWKKNLFLLPSGRAGKEFLVEMKNLIDLFINKTPYYTIALNALMVMVPLLLQKPSKNSKSSDHMKYLQKRLTLWKDGDILDILRECKKIQERLASSKRKEDPDRARKVFVRLMLQGKVASALRWLDAQCSMSSLEIDENVIHKLKEKHPPAQPSSQKDMLNGPLNRVEEVIFDQIDGNSIHRAAMTTKGSGGPTAVDADAWKRFLCSKSFGNSCNDLCESIARLARQFCTEHIPPDAIKFLVSGRLIALDKNPGETTIQIRPIGVGEVLRRIVGKSVMMVLKGDITQAAGPLQACAGHKGGVEAAVHAMKKLFSDSETEAVLLVDASNAFNSMNRGTALHNMQILCPEIATYLINTYRTPPSMYVANSNGVKILSEEGCTQGDNAGMSFYACNTTPLISLLHSKNVCNQAWFADDSAAAGNLQGIRAWWNCLNENGPTMGYYPNAGKTWLILKNENNIERARVVFEGTNVNVTTFGKNIWVLALDQQPSDMIMLKRRLTNGCSSCANYACLQNVIHMLPTVLSPLVSCKGGNTPKEQSQGSLNFFSPWKIVYVVSSFLL